MIWELFVLWGLKSFKNLNDLKTLRILNTKKKLILEISKFKIKATNEGIDITISIKSNVLGAVFKNVALIHPNHTSSQRMLQHIKFRKDKGSSYRPEIFEKYSGN